MFKVRTDFGNALFPLRITWEEYSTFLHDLISQKNIREKKLKIGYERKKIFLRCNFVKIYSWDPL